MKLIEVTAAVTAAGAALAAALGTVTAVIDDVHDGAWSHAVSCVEREVAVHGATVQDFVDAYLDGTVDPAVREQVEGCVERLVSLPDPLRSLPADVADRLGLGGA